MHGRAGAFDFDQKLMQNARRDMANLNRIEEPDFGQHEEEKKEEDNRTMLQVMQDKQKAQEVALAA